MEITELDLDKINSNPILQEEYSNILNEIQEHCKGLPFNVSSIFSTQTNKNIVIVKFISGGFWAWLLIILSPFIYNKKLRDMLVAILLFLIIGSLMGWISTLIPTFKNAYINIIGYPILLLVLGIVIGFLVRNNQKKRKHSTSPNNVCP